MIRPEVHGSLYTGDYSRVISSCGLGYGIGDVVMQLPVRDALRRAAPKARITAAGAAPLPRCWKARGWWTESCPMAGGIRHLWDPGVDETARKSPPG